MEIEFTSTKVYRYHDIPQHMYSKLIAAKSAGAFFNEAIRDRYPFEVVEG